MVTQLQFCFQLKIRGIPSDQQSCLLKQTTKHVRLWRKGVIHEATLFQKKTSHWLRQRAAVLVNLQWACLPPPCLPLGTSLITPLSDLMYDLVQDWYVWDVPVCDVLLQCTSWTLNICCSTANYTHALRRSMRPEPAPLRTRTATLATSTSI